MLLKQVGHQSRALPALLESISLLRSQPDRKDPRWADTMAQAATCVSSILEICGRYEEAAAALEEGLTALRKAGRTDMRPAAALSLIKVYTEMGQFQRAVDRGEAAVREMKESRHAGRQDASYHPMLCAVLATAYEKLGRTDKCMEHHRSALALSSSPGRRFTSSEIMSCHVRDAQLDFAAGDVESAEEKLERVLDYYKGQLVVPYGIADPCMRDMVANLRQLVIIYALQGMVAEARALKLDLDETEAIIA